MRKRNTSLWKKILIYFFAFVIFFISFYIYFKTDVFTIKSYEITGVPDQEKENILKKINELSAQPIYKIIPANKIFSFQASKINGVIKDKLPDTKKVTVTIIPLHTLRVVVTPYSPVFLMGDNKAITKEGYVYIKRDTNLNLPTINFASTTLISSKESGLFNQKLHINNTTSTEEILNQIINIIPKINSVLFNVSNIEINEYGDIILSNLDNKNSIKLSSSNDIDKEWSNVISAIDTEPLKSLLQANKEELQYIDVRFGNKVFYKFTKDGQTAIISDNNKAQTNATSTLEKPFR